MIKRILLCLLVLLGVSVILYILVRIMPSNFVNKMFDSQVSQGQLKEEDIQRMKELFGIADNSFGGILKGYFTWLGNAVRLNFGESFLYTGQTVQGVIAKYMWISFAIAFISMILAYLIAIPLGTKAAVSQYGKLDYTTSVLAMLGISLPSFFLSALLIKALCVDTGLFPVQGISDATMNWDGNPVGLFFNEAYHLVVPILVVVILEIGGTLRFTRTNTLEVLNADYIRTARAKGVSERWVVYKHSFRNTMIPLVSSLAGAIPAMFSGSIIIETVFSIPGIGNMAYKAMEAGDIPFIMGYNMFLAILTVLGTLLADLMYAVVDPRVKIMR
ncbi:MAG: ABC transporter permease [Clostridiales bacterium]|nr:ABC transporter permease [Clostridiales bacterium]